MMIAFKRRRQVVYDLLVQIPGIKTNLPEGAFDVFPDISVFIGKKTEAGETINNSADLALFLLHTGHVATVGGDSFGNDNCIRLSYAAADDQLIEALKRIKEALAKLN